MKKAEDAPPYLGSYCHFGQDWSAADFKQLLSEIFATQRNHETGKVTQGWHQVEVDNIYSTAVSTAWRWPRSSA